MCFKRKPKSSYEELLKHHNKYHEQQERKWHAIYLELNARLLELISETSLYRNRGWNELPDYVDIYNQMIKEQEFIAKLIELIHQQEYK